MERPGEGNREADRAYRDRTRAYLEKDRTERDARKAKAALEKNRTELEGAERDAKSGPARTSAEKLRRSVAETFRRQMHELEQLRDEARLKMHLGTMELSDLMTPIENQLRVLRSQASDIAEASDHAVSRLSEEAASTVAEIRKGFERVRSRIERSVRG